MPSLGIAAFGLFFLNDYNDWQLHRRWLRLCFPLGSVLLVVSVLLQCLSNPSVAPLPVLIPACLLGSFSLWMLLRALFFDLHLEEAYMTQNQGRRVCSSGLYALCRHPGVLFSAPVLVCLWLLGLPALWAAVYFALNVLLGWFEDRCVFPAVLDGWADYTRTTPFLLPVKKTAVRRFAQSLFLIFR